MNKKKEDKEPFSLKINFEVTSSKLKKFFKKTIAPIIIFGGGGTIIHGTVDPLFYATLLKRFGIFLSEFFK